MKKDVVFYNTTIKQEDLEVIAKIELEHDARRKAELILSLSFDGLDYAIYSEGLKTLQLETQHHFISLTTLPLLFLATVNGEFIGVDDNYNYFHLFSEHWNLCRDFDMFINSKPTKDVLCRSQFEVNDWNNLVDLETASFLLKEAYLYEYPTFDRHDVWVRIINRAENLDGYGSLELSKNIFHALSVMFWIAKFRRQRLVA